MGDPISTHIVGMDSGTWDIAMAMGTLDWLTFQLALVPTPIVKAPVGNGYPAPLGRGSSRGRVTPMSLNEQLAMQAVMRHPQGRILPIPMTDGRWLGADGWVKMSQNVNGVEIHYVRNTVTGAVDDFKFPLPGG